MADMEYRLSRLESDQGDLKDAVQSINESLQALVRLEERHAETREALSRAFGEIKENSNMIRAVEMVTHQSPCHTVSGHAVEIKKIDSRLTAVELAIPGLVEARSWVVKAILGLVFVVGVSVVGLVINTAGDDPHAYMKNIGEK